MILSSVFNPRNHFSTYDTINFSLHQSNPMYPPKYHITVIYWKLILPSMGFDHPVHWEGGGGVRIIFYGTGYHPIDGLILSSSHMIIYILMALPIIETSS